MGSVNNVSASGSSPASLAIIALVRRFCLYGRNKSSSVALSSAPLMQAANICVSFPCASMLSRIVARRA